MSDTLKPKRPSQKVRRVTTPRRTSSSPDGKAQSAHPVRGREASEAPVRGRDTRADALPARIAALEADLARLTEARGVDADELARMLVRIAEAERGRATAEERAQTTARRADLAERAAADGAEALAGARAEREADRARVTDLEAKLARIRREHGDELTSLRRAHAETDLKLARALEEERGAVARARQQAAAADLALAQAREIIASAAGLVDEMDRREEIAAALRARGLDQARRVLAGQMPEVAAAPPELEIDLEG
jgi:chromosome segregation ATPase